MPKTPVTPAEVLSPEENTPTALTRTPRGFNAELTQPSDFRKSLVDMWLEGQSPRTREAYRGDLLHFAHFLESENHIALESGLPREEQDDSWRKQAANFLVSLPAGQANGVVLAYRYRQQTRSLSPATINRRLTAIRSIVRLARILGQISWSIEVKGIKTKKYRDTRGPGVETILQMIERASLRDHVILCLLFFMGLRRGEVHGLEVQHVDLKEKRLSVLGKGKKEREWITMPHSVLEVMPLWLAERGTAEGRLFPVSYRTLHRIVRRLGKEVGVDAVRPHGLRHTAITTALDKHDVRRVRKFSRHQDLNTVLIYDDNRTDVAGEIASDLSDLLKNRGTK